MAKTTTARAEYAAKVKLQLDELNKKIDTLEGKAHEAQADARTKYKEEIAKLRHQSGLAMDKFDQVKHASEETWDKMVGEMDKMRNAFLHSLNYFKSQF